MEITDASTVAAQRLKSLLDQFGLRSDSLEGSVEYQSSGGPSYLALMRRLMAELD